MSEWVGELGESKQRVLLNLLASIAKHEEAYEKSEEPAIAQLWVAILELAERMERLERKIRKMEMKLAMFSAGSVVEDLKNY